MAYIPRPAGEYLAHAAPLNAYTVGIQNGINEQFTKKPNETDKFAKDYAIKESSVMPFICP